MIRNKEGERLDKLLVRKGLAKSRARAKSLIENGQVTVDGLAIMEADKVIPIDATIMLLGSDIPWVSRAGLKLDAALRHWNIDVQDKVCLDIGAATGGFTQVLLEHGAKKVYAVDVGHGQLAKSLKDDPRVVNIEGVDIRTVTKTTFSEPIEFVVIDLSFISLVHVLTTVRNVITSTTDGVILIKPQFEVGRQAIGKGIVRDPEQHQAVVNAICQHAQAAGFLTIGTLESPILGSKGNKEFFLRVRATQKI